METSAPTVRALDLEVVKLRTANVELVTALREIVERLRDGDDTGAYLIARIMSDKHGS